MILEEAPTLGARQRPHGFSSGSWSLRSERSGDSIHAPKQVEDRSSNASRAREQETVAGDSLP